MMQEASHVSVKQRAKEKLVRDAGAAFMAALHDSSTLEILLNEDGKLWQEKIGEPMRIIGELRPAQAEALIKTVAGYHGHEITRTHPILEAEFPLDGSRFAAQMPPIVSQPTFALRKKAVSLIPLDSYVESGVMSAAHRDVIAAAVDNHRNILVVGGTGSGKTTLINAIIHQMVQNAPEERVVIIEDTGEIQCRASNFVQFHTTIDIDMTRLLKTTLRMRPDRILVGEVRGPEAMDLLMAWNTGHEGGAATVHANSARAAMGRLKMLVSMNRNAPKNIDHLLAEAIHFVVHIGRSNGQRRVSEVLEVTGLDGTEFTFKAH